VSRVASLDLLRGLAAWAVAIPHFFIYHAVQPDFFEAVSILGVEIFFVLSGYVLAPQILFCVARAESRLLWIFLVRRWMRTVPAYIVALVCVSVLFGMIGSADFFKYLFYVQNLMRQNNQADYFSVAWSLSVEEWFYVVFPALLLAGTAIIGKNDTKSILAVSVVFVSVVALARNHFGDLVDWGDAVRRVVAFRVDSIAYGFLLYVLLHRVFPGQTEKLNPVAAGAVFIAVALLAFWAVVAIIQSQSLVAKHLFPWLAALFGSSCIVLAVTLERAVAARCWLSKIGLFGGKISYSVYLFHIFFLGGLGSVKLSLPTAVQFVGYLGLVTATAALFYSYFEKPILLARPDLGAPATEGIHRG
jgi:peptidoglycan/LPS O-acetylase OafA/YrhL